MCSTLMFSTFLTEYIHVQRLQRRLYGIYFLFFHMFMDSLQPGKLAEDLVQPWKPLILRVSVRVYSFINPVFIYLPTVLSPFQSF